MTRYTLTILEEQKALLERSLLRDDREYAALILCGRSRVRDPWTGETEHRFLVREIIEVDETAFLERSPTSLTWSTTPFFNVLKQLEPSNFAIAAVHSHPDGLLQFSPYDDVADKELFRIAFDYLDTELPHISAVMDRDGLLVARAIESDLTFHPISMIRVVGKRWRFSSDADSENISGAEYDRQIRAFGRDSLHKLRALRVGVVGCGGMGSAAISMLSRIGIAKLVLFDPDPLDETNLNRVHYSTRADANLSRPKVDVMAEAIASFGLSISVVRIPTRVDDERARNAIRSCDIVFGCTDDHLGRNFLNRLAHFYLIPVIDLGLLIEPREAGGYDVFDGRVTVIQPGYPCQHCRSLISSDHMLAESLRRSNPELFEQRRRAGYVPNAPDPSPVVVSFTTEVAAMAVNELFQRIIGYRGERGECAERVRRLDDVKDADTVPAGVRNPNCKLCGRRRYDGLGDMEPFLDMTP